jgi:hypothetical protein
LAKSTPAFTYITLPRDLPVVWSKLSRKEQTAIVTLYQLKACRQGGILFDYRRQLTVIAESFGYSASKLRGYIQLLVQKGWAQETHFRRHLSLISTRRLGELLGCKSTRTFRVSLPEVGELKTKLQERVLTNAFSQQRHQIREKTLNHTIRATVGIQYPEHLSPAARRHYLERLVPKAEAESLRKQALPRYEQEFVWDLSTRPGSQQAVNPDITLSRRALASLFGLRSSASGHRLAKQLASAGVLTDEPRLRRIPIQGHQEGVSYTHYQQLRRSVLDYNGRYRFRPLRDGSGLGMVCRQLPNLLTLTPRPTIT